MTDENKNTEKPDEAILFPNVTIDGILIKPWSFGKLFDLSMLLDSVINKAEAKGIIAELNSGTSVLSYTTMAKIFAIAGPEVLKIISTTTGKTEDEVRELPMTTGIQIAITILNQNIATIKNALAPLFSK